MAALRVLLWWDTEDFINPESDDALLLLLREHRKRGVPATWKMVGEKTRVLRERGRSDVIELLSDALFDVGYHTDFHSVHPTIAEYTEHCDWQEGVAEILARETDGLRLTAETFGKPVLCYGQPGASYTPHAYGAMRVWEVPCYVGGSVYLGLADRPSYLMGRLTVGWLGRASCSFPAREGERAYERAVKTMEGHLASPPAGGLVSEGNHPNEWSAAEWWDVVNFLDGANPLREDWKPAPLYERARVEEMAALFGRYLDWLLEHGVEPVSLGELFRLYGPGDYLLDGETARAAAREWAAGRVSFHFDEASGKSFSAAQLLLGLVALLVEGKEEVAVPEVDPPTAAADTVPLAAPLGREAVEGAARWLLARVRAAGSLPPRVVLPSGGRVRLEDFAAACAACYLGAEPPSGPAEFVPAGMVRRYGRDVGPWPVHHPDFSGENLHRLTCCLAWSFKPAVRLG